MPNTGVNRRLVKKKPLSSVVNNWVARVVANGGTRPSSQTISAMNSFYNTISGLGIASKIAALCVFVPDSLTAGITPLIKTNGNDPWTNHSFASADLNAYGLKGNGSSKYLETGVTPSSSILSATSCGITIYSSSPSGKADTDFGGSDGTNALQLSISNGDSTLGDCLNVGTQRITVSNPYWTGYTCLTRVANNDSRLFQASPVSAHAQLGSTNTNTGGSLPTTAAFAFATNGNGTPLAYSHKRIRLLAIHQGLTSAESASFYAAILVLDSALMASPANHSQVANWLARVAANGGATPSPATVTALNTFCNALDAHYVAPFIMALDPIVPDSLIAATTPLFLDPASGNDPWTNSNFVSGDLTVNGLLGNGTTKKLASGFVPSVEFTGTSGGMTIYNFTASGGGTEQDMGENTDGSNCMQLHIDVAGNAICDCYNDSGGRITASNSGWKGYLSMNKTASNVFKLYKANSTTAHAQLGSTNTNTSGAPGTVEIYCFARNNGAGGTSFSTKRLSFSAIHFGLTSQQSSDLYNAVQQLRTDLGGGNI
jgi:hypothetical protein